MWEAALRKLDVCNNKLVSAQTMALDAIIAIAEFFGKKVNILLNCANNLRSLAKVNREMGLTEGSGELLDMARDFEKEAIALEKQAAQYKQLTARSPGTAATWH